MYFRQFIDKKSKAKTPILIKIVVIIQIWFLLNGLTKGAGFLTWVSLITSSLQVVALIAIWNLRKWGIIAFTVIAVLGFIMALPSADISVKIIFAIVLFRGIVIIPALIYWKLMT